MNNLYEARRHITKLLGLTEKWETNLERRDSHELEAKFTDGSYLICDHGLRNGPVTTYEVLHQRYEDGKGFVTLREFTVRMTLNVEVE